MDEEPGGTEVGMERMNLLRNLLLWTLQGPEAGSEKPESWPRLCAMQGRERLWASTCSKKTMGLRRKMLLKQG